MWVELASLANRRGTKHRLLGIIRDQLSSWKVAMCEKVEVGDCTLTGPQIDSSHLEKVIVRLPQWPGRLWNRRGTTEYNPTTTIIFQTRCVTETKIFQTIFKRQQLLRRISSSHLVIALYAPEKTFGWPRFWSASESGDQGSTVQVQVVTKVLKCSKALPLMGKTAPKHLQGMKQAELLDTIRRERKSYIIIIDPLFVSGSWCSSIQSEILVWQGSNCANLIPTSPSAPLYVC